MKRSTALIAATALLAANCSSPSTPSADVAALTPRQVAACRKALASLSKIGTVKKLTVERIDVDDTLWAVLPASQKETLLRAVACALRGRALKMGEQTSAYGYFSGKELAYDRVGGVTFN